MKIKTQKKSGFTLIETIIALTLGLTVVSMITFLSSEGIKDIRAIQQQERLQANAMSLSDSFSYWIKKGEVFNALSSSHLQITMPDSSEKCFEWAEDTINLDEESIVSDDVKVTDLQFIPMEHSVQISFTLENQNSNAKLSTKTTVAQRNSF